MKMNIRLRPDADVRAETIKIGKMSALVVRPKGPGGPVDPRRRIHHRAQGNGLHVAGNRPREGVSCGCHLPGLPAGDPASLSGGAQGLLQGAHLYEGARGGAWNQQEPAHGRRGECRRRTYRRALHAREG